jgi:hypothetical protein
LDGQEGIRDLVELMGELRLLTVKVVVAIYFCNHCQVVELLSSFNKHVEAPVLTGEEGGEPGGSCICWGVLSIVRMEEEFSDICGFPRLPPCQ